MRTIVLGLLFAFTACSSSSTTNMDGSVPPDLAAGAGNGGNGPADLGKTAATVTVKVPPDFTGTPRQLLVAAFDQFPVTGPPAGILYQGTPTITPGATLQLTADATGLSGTKYVLAVLYVQGGGQFTPTPGVDYASAPEMVTFTGGAINLGPLTLVLVPTVDGGP